MPQRPPEALRRNLEGRLLRAVLLCSDGVLGNPETEAAAQEDWARPASHEFCPEDGAESGSPETEQAAENSRASSSLSPGSLPGFFKSLFEAASSLGAAAVWALACRVVLARRVLICSAILSVPYTGLGISSGRRHPGGLAGTLRRGFPGGHVPLNRFLVTEQLSVAIPNHDIPSRDILSLDYASLLSGSRNAAWSYANPIGVFLLV
jgi:hypothetical protein